MEGIEEFKALLQSLQSSQNDIRSTAEQTYETIQASTKFNFLMNVISNRENPQQDRVFSGVLCRRLLDVSYDDAFDCVVKESQVAIKSQILQLLASESDNLVRKKLAEITLEVARRQFDVEGNCEWHDLLTFVFNVCINNSNEALRITGLSIFSGLPNLLDVNTEANFNLIGTTLSKCLSPQNENCAQQSIEVREAAVRALCSFVVQKFDDNLRIGQLRSLVPLLLQTIIDSINESPFDDNVMKAFIELVDEAPGFLKNSVTQVIQLCITILQNTDIEETQKHLAVEVFVSLSESCTNAVRKTQGATHTMMQYLFQMLTDIEDDNEWSNVDEEEIEDDSTNHVTAEIALDRLAVAMKGKRLLDEIKQTVPGMLHSNDWKQRHGGLKAISSMGEGLQKVMSEILGSIINEVVKLLNDPHPRVRYAACVCVGQMSTDFEPKLQTMFHDVVMPALMTVLGDDGNPRVQAYACSALTNFCEGASRDVLCQYLPVLADKLLTVLKTKCEVLGQSRKKLVLEQVVTTVAAVSDTAGHRFEPYYGGFMPFMKWIMSNCDVEDLKLLRGKSIECISLMGLAVGKDRFLVDAQEVMNLLIGAQISGGEGAIGGTGSAGSGGGGGSGGAGISGSGESTMGPDDPQHSYMISAWARICKLMGTDFAPYLKYVMGAVLRTASMKPETCFMYDDETHDMDKDKDWQVVRVGQDQNVGINTSGIEDKINACQMLICYARELKQHFAPYVFEVAKIMLPLLKFYLNDDIRSAAADIVPYLIDCSVTLGEAARTQLWQEMLTALLDALNAEEEKVQQADMLGAIGEGIVKMGVDCLDAERLNSVCELMTKFFEEIFKNQEARAAKRKADDYDDEEEENLEADKDEDDNILGKLVGVSHALFKVYGNRAVSFFQRIYGYIIKLLEPGRPYTDLQYGICFLDDVVEFTGHNSYQYCVNFLPVFRTAILHIMPEVRQAAAYGFGLMAVEGGPQYAPFLSEMAHVMVGILSRDDCRSTENNLSSENVISALTKICKYQPSCVPGGGDINQFLVLWITWLPIYEDEEETPHVYGYLCELLENNNPVIIGTDNSNLVRVVKSIATCISKQALPTEHAVYNRCLNLVKMIQMNEQLFNQCVQNLSDDEKMSLKEALDKVSN